jgi:hypothetical protein
VKEPGSKKQDPDSRPGRTVNQALERLRPESEAITKAAVRLLSETANVSRLEHPRGGGFRDARYGTTSSGSHAGGHYLHQNRFDWWSAIVPPTGPLMEGGGAVEGSNFASEFDSPLAIVVGDMPTGVHPRSRLVDWSGASPFSLANDAPGLPFVFQAPPGEHTILIGRNIIANGQQRSMKVAYNAPDAFGERPTSRRIAFAFALPQRAVGVEVGYISSDSDGDGNLASHNFRMVARTSNGMSIESGGSDLMFRRHVPSFAMVVAMAVRDVGGQIVSVEVYLQGDEVRPLDNIFIGRVWCEALPPAAVWQGVVTAGNTDAFIAQQHRNHPDVLSRTVVEDGATLPLPFRCDRAIVLPRGIHLTSVADQPGETRGFRINLDSDATYISQPGGSIRLNASGRWWLRDEEERETFNATAAVYVTVLAWDSQQVDLYSAPVRPVPSIVANGQPVTVTVPNPNPAAVAAIADGQDPTQASGTLFAGLTTMNMSWSEWSSLESVQFSVGTVNGGGLTRDSSQPGLLRVGDVAQLTPPRLTHAGDHVTWGVVFSLGDTDTGHDRGTFPDHADRGIILTGQGLRVAGPWVARFGVPDTGRRSSQARPYFVSQLDVVRLGAGMPIDADLACVSLGGMIVIPDNEDIRGFDVEVRGAEYSGGDLVYELGGGGDTGPDNEPFFCTPIPYVFGVVRRTLEGRERVVSRDAVFGWYEGLITVGPEIPGVLRNEGNTTIAVTGLSLEGETGEFAVEISYRGEILQLDQADDRARAGQFWLAPGEAFTVGGRFYTTASPAPSGPGQPDRSIQFREATVNGGTIRRATVVMRAYERQTNAHGMLLPARITLGRIRRSPAGAQQQSARNYAMIISDGQSPLSVHSLTFQPPVPGLRIGLREGAAFSGSPHIDPNAVYQVDPGNSLWFQIDFTPEAVGPVATELVAETNSGRMRLAIDATVDPAP